MARLERKAMAHYLDSTFGNVLSSVAWFKIGIDNEDLSVALNPDTSTIKNVWGEPRVTDNGYEPTMDADPYYADPSDAIYPKISSIAFDRKVGDDCKTLMLEVIVKDTADENHLAYVETVMVKPQSYGGPNGGINIPYNVAFNGSRIKGYVTAASVTAGAPVFAEGDIPTP